MTINVDAYMAISIEQNFAEMNHLWKNHEISHETACLYCFSH